MQRHGGPITSAGGRLLVGAVVAVLVVGACGAGASPSTVPAGSAAAAFAAPERIKEAGTLTTCTDTTNPPSASYAEDGTTPEGFDIDIAAEIARRWGVTSSIHSTEFGYLIRDLRAGSCDLVIGDMTSTFGDRAEQVDFVDYLRTWTAFFVAPGNPKGITTTVDLAGKSIAVDPGYASEAALLAASDDLVAAGKPAIDIIAVTKSDEYWAEELVAGRVDALAGESVEAVYRVDKPPFAGVSEVGGPALDPQPLGIAIRKDDAGMKDAVAAAIDAMYADGTMQSIVEKWGMTDAVELLK
jgi:polar amino acid transport system substrate-binding protein